MGHSSTQRNVMLVLGALETIMAGEGATLTRGAALAAVADVYGAVAKG